MKNRPTSNEVVNVLSRVTSSNKQLFKVVEGSFNNQPLKIKIEEFQLELKLYK